MPRNPSNFVHVSLTDHRVQRPGQALPNHAPEPGELQRTPVEIEGPYFRLGAPERSNLLEPGDKPELVLTGRVLNERGTPIPNAVVALWSSDAVGNYDMIGYKYHGYQVTDAGGHYEFTTIIPGCNEPRCAKHPHVNAQGNGQPNTTQLNSAGGPGNGDDGDYYYTPQDREKASRHRTEQRHHASGTRKPTTTA